MQHLGYVTNRKFTPNETTGYNCWCKITYPEQSKWVLAEDFGNREWVHTYEEGIEGQTGTGTERTDIIYVSKKERIAECALSCPKECILVLPELFHSIGKK